ncbi:MAG: NAD-dependent succinate-semialdehyde dehydrogenase [Firmicutes bacterium]|nr:NAD-dependent succinate-semialdehyde dehydrogenase [Bacillota bacterium]
MEFASQSLFIGGEWRPAHSGKTFPVINPATEEVIATVPDGHAHDMQDAIAAAADAQTAWGDTVASERAGILRRAADLMREEQDALAHIMTLEEGKPLADARAEVAYATSFVSWFGEEARRIYGETVPASSPDKRIFVIKRPVGVTAAITPWNFPAAMITRKLAAALAAGCSMVVKPSELTPLTALNIARIFEQAGLPKGVLSVVAGTDAAALAGVIMDDFRVRKVSFTGSTEVGKLLMRQAADTMKRLSLELGGHAPFIVFADADMESALAHAVACKMRGMGETCVAANRFYVAQSHASAFSEELARRLGAMRVGNGLDPTISVGPLIAPSAVEKVRRHVQDAVASGAHVLTGGEDAYAALAQGGKGYFYPPTVLTDVKDTMAIAREETFGPVAAVLAFDSEQEVVRRANDTQFGLAAYCFTRDAGRVWRLADTLQYGIIGVNDGTPSTAQAPFGGIKASGYGREGSRHGIDEYLDIKYVSQGGILAP